MLTQLSQDTLAVTGAGPARSRRPTLRLASCSQARTHVALAVVAVAVTVRRRRRRPCSARVVRARGGTPRAGSTCPPCWRRRS
jgi:hypothetical protein